MSRTLTKVGITRATFRRLSRFAGAGKPFKQVTLVERGIRLVLEELESNNSHAQDSFRNPERALLGAGSSSSQSVGAPNEPSTSTPLGGDAAGLSAASVQCESGNPKASEPSV